MSRTIEFETELTGGNTLELPPEIASALPSQGRATVVVFVDMDPEDAAWQKEAYKQFLSDDSTDGATPTYGTCHGLGLAEPKDLPLPQGNPTV